MKKFIIKYKYIFLAWLFFYFLFKNSFLKFYYKYIKLKTFLKIFRFKKKINEKINEVTEVFENDFKNNYKNITHIPDISYNEYKVNTIISTMLQHNFNNTKLSGVIYHCTYEHQLKLLNVFEKFCWSNPLHPDIFPKIREMEIDTINMVIELFKGDNKCVGNITSGGTESILLACKTYRDWAKDTMGIITPNIVCLESVHPAFDKACHYFNIKMIKVPIESITGTQTPEIIEKYINCNTICLVGSAPGYAHGILDPINEISDLAYKKKIGFHLDCCMGGFLVPFLENINIDFRLKGITSISADTHKYGYSFKGSSVLLFRTKEYKKYQHFINTKWNGGIYATPTILGSKSGALIATTWASLLYIGKQKYKEIAINILNAINRIKKEFQENSDIQIIGNPNINIIAFESKVLDIYSIVDEMKKKEWNLSILQYPSAFHLCITNIHLKDDIISQFIVALKESIEIVKKSPNKKLKGTLALYGSTTNMDFKESYFLREIVNNYVFLLSKKKISNINQKNLV